MKLRTGGNPPLAERMQPARKPFVNTVASRRAVAASVLQARCRGTSTEFFLLSANEFDHGRVEQEVPEPAPTNKAIRNRRAAWKLEMNPAEDAIIRHSELGRDLLGAQ